MDGPVVGVVAGVAVSSSHGSDSDGLHHPTGPPPCLILYLKCIKILPQSKLGGRDSGFPHIVLFLCQDGGIVYLSSGSDYGVTDGSPHGFQGLGVHRAGDIGEVGGGKIC